MNTYTTPVMSIPIELDNKVRTDEALQALKEGDTQKCGSLITKWQNDLQSFRLMRQDIEEILHHCQKFKNVLQSQPNNNGCLQRLEALISDIVEELNID